ncbi:hypothetical protein IAU60_002490 [Kwoniella sp. DSM 27419]
MWSSFTYHEPSINSLLILSSFIYLLNLFGWLSQHVLSAELLGQILIGVIYGTPLAGWLDQAWQEAFVAVGYVGLLLIVFEGGLSSSFDNVVTLLPLSICVALTGILAPIGLSFVLMPLVSSSPLHAFAAGAALSSTSLGTSLSVLSPASVKFDLRQTRLGTTLLTAAVMDDVVAFVLASILGTLGEGSQAGGSSIGTQVGRTVGVTIGLGLVLATITRFVLGPLYARLQSREHWRHATWGGQGLLIGLMVGIFIGLIAAAGYAGTSPLYGAYCAGLACAYLSDHVEVPSRMEQAMADKSVPAPLGEHKLARCYTFPGHQGLRRRLSASHEPLSPIPATQAPARIIDETTLRAAFERYLGPLLSYLLLPIFFGSIGYSIPFVPLWKGRVIWRGIIYALLMILGKVFCGAWLLVWPKSEPSRSTTALKEVASTGELEAQAAAVASRHSTGSTDSGFPWTGVVFLGSAMTARGEIGLLISQIAYHTPNPLLTEDEFLVVNWAIILCTVAGPLSVGFVVRRYGRQITNGGWA